MVLTPIQERGDDELRLTPLSLLATGDRWRCRYGLLRADSHKAGDTRRHRLLANGRIVPACPPYTRRALKLPRLLIVIMEEAAHWQSTASAIIHWTKHNQQISEFSCGEGAVAGQT